jgi:hypothetical protein
LSVKECDLGRPLGGCTKTYYNSIQNLKQVKMSSNEEFTSIETKIVDDIELESYSTSIFYKFVGCFSTLLFS